MKEILFKGGWEGHNPMYMVKAGRKYLPSYSGISLLKGIVNQGGFLHISYLTGTECNLAEFLLKLKVLKLINEEWLMIDCPCICHIEGSETFITWFKRKEEI